ncbi:MAG: hypothetical protein IJH09_01430 [Clostridia bacterium]|nr:hypothetical protein [Clostridia bacterium]
MRRMICTLIALALLMSVWTVQAEASSPVPYAFERIAYSTMIDPSWRPEWEDGVGLYFHFGEDNMPYILVQPSASDDRITDGEAFLKEYLPQLQDQYLKNGAVSTSLHGGFRVAGRPVAAGDVQYHNDSGLKIYYLIVVDVHEDYSVVYRVRYLDESQRQEMLDGLDLIAANLQRDGQAASDQPSPAPGNVSAIPSAGVNSLAITDVREDANALGRCVAPADYDVKWDLTCCTLSESYSNPYHVAILASNDADDIEMRYVSIGDYLAAADGSTENDNTFNTDFYTPMLHYMDASEYADYLALRYYPEAAGSLKLISEDPCAGVQRYLDQQAKEDLSRLRSETRWTVINVDANEYTACAKLYAFERDGAPYRLSVLTAVKGTRYTTSYDGLKPGDFGLVYGKIETSTIGWEVPFVFIMACPEKNWATAEAVFEHFTANTRVSDQFLTAKKRLADALWNIVAGTKDLSAARSYCKKVMREETENSDDYNEDVISDYIFDQNDYTLSDGSHVKVSTRYDYVYEGDNGVVYYSDSAFAPTNGGTQLYPN